MSRQSTTITQIDRSGPAASTGPAADYDGDLVRWAEANAALLRQGRLTEIDAEHLAEELEDMGKSERRALASQLRVLIAHLLKWQYQPERRGNSWRFSVLNARAAIAEIIEDSPSLGPKAEALMLKGWPLARAQAVAETGLPDKRFPPECPYRVDQVLDDAFWPESDGG
jgi:hypothetical protein